MSRPCCNSDLQACFDLQEDELWRCEFQNGTLGPPGTCCADPFDPGSDPCIGGFDECWHCEWEVGGLTRQSCCFFDLNFHWMPSIKAGQCTGCGGTVGTPEHECGIHRKPECIEPREDREASGSRWSLNATDAVVLGVDRITAEYPDDWPRGYNVAVSTHRTRPTYDPVSPLNDCAHAVGRLTMLDDGYCYMATCSKPDPNNDDSLRRSYAVLRTSPETNPLIGVEAGYQYWVGCIHLPWWTEATYRSHRAICLPEPE